MDTSVYDVDPPVPAPLGLEVKVPGFNVVYPSFTIHTLNTYNSTDLGITTAGNETDLPDGIYCFKYSLDVNTYVEKTIIRVDKLQEKFDNAFMKLDMMECDQAIKDQSKNTLFTIYFYIQGAIAAANNCANVHSTKLYNQASRMLDEFISKSCGCF